MDLLIISSNIFQVDKNDEEPENKHSHIKTTIKESIDNPSSHQDSSSFSGWTYVSSLLYLHII